MRQGLEHGGLSPVEIRRLRGHQWILPVVEITAAILQVPDGPVRYQVCQPEGIRIPFRKEAERINRLTRALDIHRVSPIMIIAGASRFLEENLFVIIVAPVNWPLEGFVSGVLGVPEKTVEIVRSVETVDPQVGGTLGIPP